VSLATNRHARIRALSFKMARDDASIVHQIRPDRGFDEDERDGKLKTLFAFPDEGERFSHLVKRWLGLWRQHRKLFGLVFGLVEAPPVFVEVRLSQNYAAFEMLSDRVLGTTPEEAVRRSRYGEALVPETFWRSLQDALASARDEGRPTSEGAFYLGEALGWFLKTSLLDALGLDPEPIKNSFEFKRNAEWLRNRLENPSIWSS
jgi:hypothetical protein